MLMIKKIYVTATNKKSKPWEAGKRIIQKQNYSYVLTVPKIWVDTYCENNREVNLQMENSGILTVIPSSTGKGKKK